jgi:hypothetical protein
MLSPRYSKDEEELQQSSLYLDLSSHSRSRSNTNYTSNFSPRSSDGSEEQRYRSSLTSPSIPISPLMNHYSSKQLIRENLREQGEIVAMEMEFQCKTLEMLALIKGTTPQKAYLTEKLEEIRSQRSKSNDYDDSYDETTTTYSSSNVCDSEYLIGSSYEEVFDNEEQQSLKVSSSEHYDEHDDEEDIFGMEV